MHKIAAAIVISVASAKGDFFTQAARSTLSAKELLIETYGAAIQESEGMMPQAVQHNIQEKCIIVDGHMSCSSADSGTYHPYSKDTVKDVYNLFTPDNETASVQDMKTLFKKLDSNLDNVLDFSEILYGFGQHIRKICGLPLAPGTFSQEIEQFHQETQMLTSHKKRKRTATYRKRQKKQRRTRKLERPTLAQLQFMYEEESKNVVTISQLEQMYNEESEMPLVSTNLQSQWQVSDRDAPTTDLVWEAGSLYDDDEPINEFGHYWLEKQSLEAVRQFYKLFDQTRGNKIRLQHWLKVFTRIGNQEHHAFSEHDMQSFFHENGKFICGGITTNKLKKNKQPIPNQMTDYAYEKFVKNTFDENDLGKDKTLVMPEFKLFYMKVDPSEVFHGDEPEIVWERIFQLFDQNQDGDLTWTEVWNVLYNNKQEQAATSREVATDELAKLNRQERASLFKQLNEEQYMTAVKWLFAWSDINQDGELDLTEFKTLYSKVQNSKMNPSDEKWQLLFTQLDSNDNGTLQWDEVWNRFQYRTRRE